jgi:hypothetical protein
MPPPGISASVPFAFGCADPFPTPAPRLGISCVDGWSSGDMADVADDVIWDSGPDAPISPLGIPPFPGSCSWVPCIVVLACFLVAIAHPLPSGTDSPELIGMRPWNRQVKQSYPQSAVPLRPSFTGSIVPDESGAG